MNYIATAPSKCQCLLRSLWYGRRPIILVHITIVHKKTSDMEWVYIYCNLNTKRSRWAKAGKPKGTAEQMCSSFWDARVDKAAKNLASRGRDLAAKADPKE